jgi:hypothetical protein
LRQSSTGYKPKREAIKKRTCISDHTYQGSSEENINKIAPYSRKNEGVFFSTNHDASD